MLQLKQMRPKDPNVFPIFFAELRHRLSQNKAVTQMIRSKRLSVFAFENVIKKTLSMDLDVKLIRAAFRTVEDVSANLSFHKLLHALVSSAVTSLARPLKVLQQNRHDLWSIQEHVAAKLFLSCEANMRTAAERMAKKLDANFIPIFIQNVKATNSGSLSREELLQIAAKSREFLSFELEYFFGRIFDLVVLHSHQGSSAKVEIGPLVALIVLLSSCLKAEKTQFVFQIVDSDDDGCLSAQEMYIYFQLLTQWSGIAKNDHDAINLDSRFLNFELARQQAKRLADIVVPPCSPADSHLLINYSAISRALKFIDHLIPGIQSLRWLLPESPPYQTAWDQIVQARTERRKHNYVARRHRFLAALTTTHGLARPIALSLLQKLTQEEDNFWDMSDNVPDETERPIDSDDEEDQLIWRETESNILRRANKATIPLDPLLELKTNIHKLRVTSMKSSEMKARVDAQRGKDTMAGSVPSAQLVQECANRAVSAIRGVPITTEASDSENEEIQRPQENHDYGLKEITSQEVESVESLMFGRPKAVKYATKPVVTKELTSYNCLVCKAPHKIATLKYNE